MSLTHEQTTTAPSKPMRFLWFRILFPVVVLIGLGGFFAVPWIMLRRALSRAT